MSRETAVTEEITYETQHCHVCGTEVATDSSAPADTLEPHAYAVVLGEGAFRQEVEYEANWDKELRFELEEEDSRLPTVEGYVVCERCARSIHQHPEDARTYTGSIPNDLQPGSAGEFPLDRTTALALLAVLIVVLLLLLLL